MEDNVKYTFTRIFSRRKQAEQALKESEARYRTLFDLSPCAILLEDSSGRILEANEAICRSFGYSRSELVGMHISMLVPPDQRHLVQEHASVILSGQNLFHEVDNVAKDGTLHRMELRETTIHLPGGELGILVASNDVTDRRSAERSLRESEDLHRKLVSASPDAITMTDIESRITFLSPRARELFGIAKPEDAIGRSALDWVAPTDRGKAIENIEAILRTGKAIYQEFDLLKEDGTKFTGEISAALIQNFDGAPKGAIIITRDITKRKRAEEQLRVLSLAVEQSPASIVITDTEGSIEYVNRMFEQVSGYERGEALGQNPRILKSGDTPAEEYAQLWQTLASGGEWRGEFRNKKKDGESYLESAWISPVRNESGAIAHYVAIKEDISAQRKAQEELHLNEARRRELERQLLQSQKLESLGTLASGIAHDFNNILGIILGNAALIEDSAVPGDKTLTRVTAIQRAADRGASLVRQLLTFARKSESVRKRVSVNETVTEILRLLRETIPATIELVPELDPALPDITADSTQIHQVLINLCVNARDAMPAGGRLIIATEERTREDVADEFPGSKALTYVCISVADTGIGMDKEVQQRIFDPFFTTKGPGKGTGLGLSLVYSIVEAHQGMISVDSKEGRGSTFRVFFPIVEDAGQGIDISGEIDKEPVGGTETILLVEDEVLLAEMLHDVLTSKGYNVLVAPDGEAGLARFKANSNEIDIVLSDIGLPKIDGRELVKLMRGITPDVKVVLATGYLDPGEKARLLDAGVLDVVQKPYSAKSVLRAIRIALDKEGK
jgi:PAS domain S-box-containing protein